MSVAHITKFTKSPSAVQRDAAELKIPNPEVIIANELIYNGRIESWDFNTKQSETRSLVLQQMKGEKLFDPDLRYAEFRTKMSEGKDLVVGFTPDGNMQGRDSDIEYDLYQNPEGIFQEGRPDSHNDDYYVAVVTPKSFYKIIMGEDACKCFVELLKRTDYTAE